MARPRESRANEDGARLAHSRSGPTHRSAGHVPAEDVPAGAPTLRAAWTRRAVPLAVATLVALAFAPAFEADFVNWDDDLNLLQNHRFRGLGREHLAWMFTTNWMGPYQPLAWLSFALDHALWGLGGPPEYAGAGGYHATNVLLHALAALAFCSLALRVFATSRGEQASQRAAPLAAAFAALVFAVHPLRVESVAWVTERRDVLCGVFYALSAWAYVRWAPRAEIATYRPLGYALALAAGALALALFFASVDLAPAPELHFAGPGAAGLALAGACAGLCAFAAVCAVRHDGARSSLPGFALALGCFALALLSKGLALALPIVLIALDLGALGRGRTRYAREGAPAPASASAARALVHLALEKTPMFVLSAAFAALALWGQASQAGTLVTWARHTLSERLAQAGFGLAFYPAKTLAPFALSPIYDLPETLSFSQARFLVPAIAVVAATIALLRRRAPALLAAWIAYGVSIAPVLGFSQAGPQIAADRYSYLACMPFALLAGGAWLQAWTRGASTRAAASIAAIGALAALSVLTLRQTRVWRDSGSLWQHALEIEPRSPMAHRNMGLVEVERAARESDREEQRRRLAAAMAHFDQGRTHETDPLLLAGQALVHQRLWELDPGASREHAERSVELALRAREMAAARGELTADYDLNLGSALFNAGRLDEALPYLESFARARPDHFLGRFNAGFALVRTQRFADAVRHLERAVELEPEQVNAWGNLGFAYEGSGDDARAIEAYRRVLALAPDHPTAKKRLSALNTTE